MQTIKRVIPGLILVTALLSGGGGAYGAQERQANSTTLRDKPLVTDRIQMIAGESRSALRETGAVSLASVISSRTTPPLSFPIRVEIVEVSGAPQLQVTTPPATPAGEYTVDLTALADDGREISATLHVTVHAVTVAASSSVRPPVVLLNGWQALCLNTASTLLASEGTFGHLHSLLEPDAPVLFFNNCTYGDAKIEQLASQLGAYIAGLHYTDGTPVAQVDLVTHSMGGLIARAYLAGLQTDGSLRPPPDPQVRKLVEIATPNFGSFQAPNVGVQAPEMNPGSAFLWYLATWNQRQDDLRGVDALAIIGDAGTSRASDGVVSLTSASLGFARDQSRTRILPYCHTDPGFFASFGMSCSSAPGIANVDKAPETGSLVRSFLADTPDWRSAAISATPNQNSWLSQYGGIFFADVNATGQYVNDLTGVLWGTVTLQNGGATNAVFYDEFVMGTGTFSMTSRTLGTMTCGPFTAPIGYYYPVRCKASPSIFSVTPLLANVAGRVVQSGTTITITGAGFGQRCSTCGVLAGSLALQITSWSDQAIAAFLPAFTGYTQIAVLTSAGQDSIGIMAALAPAIAVAPANLTFQYTIGGASPSGQLIQLTNSGGGTLNWTATSNASWLKVTPASGAAPSTLTVSVVPSGLVAGTYSGSIQISSVGASNSPVAVPVTLIVAPQPPVIALSAQSLQFSYTIGGSVPAGQSIQVTNAGGGTLNWTATSNASWLSMTPTSGTVPSTLTASVAPSGLAAATYSGNIQIASVGASNTPVTVPVSLVVAPAQPAAIAVTSAASYAEPPVAPGMLAVVWWNGGPDFATATLHAPSVPLPTSMGGVSATITDAGGTSRNVSLLDVTPRQLNVVIPDAAQAGTATVTVNGSDGTARSGTVTIASVAPGLFSATADGKGVAVGQAWNVKADGSYTITDLCCAAGGAGIPINMGADTDTTLVVLYGTGLRGRTNLANVSATVGGQTARVDYAGQQGSYVGLDQLNLALPRSLRDQGTVSIALTVDGKAANALNIVMVP